MQYLLLLGALPTIVILFIINKNAVVKKVPFKKLAKVFAISALSTIPAAIFESVGQAILLSFMNVNSIWFWFAYCIFVIALAEEGCKYLSFKLMIFNDRQFSNTYDGLFYGAAAALGFATLENFLYIFMRNGDGLTTALMRAVMSVPGHASTGIFMGYYFGISKYKKYNNIHTDINPQRKAYVVSVLLHGLYDFFLMIMQLSDEAMQIAEFGAVIVILIIEYVIMVKTVRRGKRESFNIYNRFYYEKMNGAMQDMVGQTNEHLVQIPAYNYNSVPMSASRNFGNVQPSVPQMNGGYPQSNVPQMNGGYPQSNVPQMNGGYPQSSVPQMSGGYPQPNVPQMNGGYPQSSVPQMNGGYPQSSVPQMNGGYPQSSVPQMNVGIAVQDDEQDERRREEAFMQQLNKPVNRPIDVIFDTPEPKICPQCGAVSGGNNKFCAVCGAKL